MPAVSHDLFEGLCARRRWSRTSGRGRLPLSVLAHPPAAPVGARGLAAAAMAVRACRREQAGRNVLPLMSLENFRQHGRSLVAPAPVALFVSGWTYCRAARSVDAGRWPTDRRRLSLAGRGHRRPGHGGRGGCCSTTSPTTSRRRCRTFCSRLRRLRLGDAARDCRDAPAPHRRIATCSNGRRPPPRRGAIKPGPGRAQLFWSRWSPAAGRDRRRWPPPSGAAARACGSAVALLWLLAPYVACGEPAHRAWTMGSA